MNQTNKISFLSQMRERAEIAIATTDHDRPHSPNCEDKDCRIRILGGKYLCATFRRKAVVLVICQQRWTVLKKIAGCVWQFYNLGGSKDPYPHSASSMLGLGDMLDSGKEFPGDQQR